MITHIQFDFAKIASFEAININSDIPRIKRRIEIAIKQLFHI
jgi:hypothetical protein